MMNVCIYKQHFIAVDTRTIATSIDDGMQLVYSIENFLNDFSSTHSFVKLSYISHQLLIELCINIKIIPINDLLNFMGKICTSVNVNSISDNMIILY